MFLRFRRTGHAEALAATFAATAPELLRVAAFLLPRDEVEDAVHDTFVVAMTRQEVWDEQRPLLPWLLGVLANEARSRRRRRRQQQLGVPAVDASTLDPVAAAQATEFGEGLARTLRNLPSNEAELLRLHLFDELSCREIGERLRRPAGTVRTQVSRAMGELRRRLPVALGAAAVMPPVQLPLLATLRDRVLNSAQGPAVIKALGAARMRSWLAMAVAAVALVGLAAGLWFTGVFDPALPPRGERATAATADIEGMAPSIRPPTSAAGELAPTVRELAAPMVSKVATWQLRGRVHDEAGRGIVDAEIALRHGEFEPRILATRSGADGAYTLDLSFWRERPALDRSRGFFVKVQAKGHHSFPHFGRFEPTASPQTELALTADFELGPYPTISGRLVDSFGKPVAGLIMADNPKDLGHMYGLAHAEADGTFLLVVAGIDAGQVALTASHAAGAPFTTTAEVTEGRDLDLGTIALLPGHPVRGRVELRDGSPVADCEVTLHTDGVRGGNDEVRTDADGRFTYVRPLANAWSAQLMKVSTQQGSGGQSYPFAAEATEVRLPVDAALLELQWTDPEGSPLLPQYATAKVRDGTSDELFAEQNGELAWLLVPPNSRVHIQATTASGCVVDQELTAPAGGRQRSDLRYRQLPRAAFRVDLVWGDGTPLTEFDCHVSSAEPGSQVRAERTRQAPGHCEWLAPIGKVTITARGYPSMYDGGEVELTATVLADGTGSAKVVVPRHGRIAITLRDTAAADRIDDKFAADVTVAGEPLSSFIYTEGDTETDSSEPPLGRKLGTLQLLLPGTHEVCVTAEGWLPAKATVEVRADQVTEVVVWLQKR